MHSWRLGGDVRSFSITPIVLELTSSARFAGQGAPEMLLPPPPQHWGSRHAPHLASHTVAGDLNSGPLACPARAQPAEPSPQHRQALSKLNSKTREFQLDY